MNFVTAFSRLAIKTQPFTKSISSNAPLLFRATPCLLAEPLKKKKRLDPAIIKAREDRRKKKLEKQIRRLEKNARQLKPIDECEVPVSLVDHLQQRRRKAQKLTPEVKEQRILLEKQWAKYKSAQFLNDIQMIDRIQLSQQRALDELRIESEELYQEAIQIDPWTVPYKSQGPVETPPIENYDSPDGEYEDISKKWE